MLRAVSQLLVVIVVLAISPTSSEQCVNAVSEMMAEWTSGQSQGNSSRSSTEAVVTWSLHHVSLLCRLDFFLASLSYSVREYVFYVFFRFQKNMTFYVFLK